MAKAKKAAKQETSDDEVSFRFAPSVEGGPSLHTDERIALLAVCVALQQGAGFRNYIDIREFNCPTCNASGFNTGWGVSRYTCGAEWHHDEEGTCAEPCPHEPTP